MKTIEIMGRTVDDAVKNALEELKVTRDKVDIEVIEQGSKGLFKILGSKPAKIRVHVKKNYLEEANVFLRNILDSMKVEAEISIKEENNIIFISLTGIDMGIIIGHRGETLDSLQYLVSLVVNKDKEAKYKRVVLDTENYRLKREETLGKLALRTADKVRRDGRAFKLEPMNPYERRIIHAALQESNDIVTLSEGEEPYRRVVIDLKRKP